MLEATITITENRFDIQKLFSFEDKEFKNERASYEIKVKDNKLIFEIKSKDPNALRSILNTITKLLSVYEKTKEILKK